MPEREYLALAAWASTFWEFQRDWLFDTADYAICNKSRQIGLSHTSGALGALWGIFHGETTTIISLGDRESSEVLDKAKRHADVIAQLGSGMARTTKKNATEIAFASGGRVLALPRTAGRGFTGNVVLDEFAYHETFEEKVWDAALAVTMLGNRGRVISTPNGVGNKFADVWREAGDPEFGWRRHEIPIERAIADGYPVDIKKCWTLAANNDMLFQQLFKCAFIDANSRFLFRQVPNGAQRYDVIPDGARYCIGLDFAYTAKTSSDYSVAVVLAELHGIYYVVNVLRLNCEIREFRDKVQAMMYGYQRPLLASYVANTERGGIEFYKESGLPIVELIAVKDKFQRAIPAATAWNEARFMFPRKAQWFDQFMSEMTGFTGVPGKDRHDDIVDALAGAFDGMTRSGGIDWAQYDEFMGGMPKALEF